jgi:sugar phosphate isomerase/epimerase
MRLSISNIGWGADNDAVVYDRMREYGYAGLEIAPTRIFPESPYEKLKEAESWAKELNVKDGFVVPSIQSIWFGRQEKLFGSEEERQALVDYTKKAVCFAEVIGCKNLVFGCPRNRSLPEDADSSVAIAFFRELGDYAAKHRTVIGMEANPPIYNTNYINDTKSALELIEQVGSEGFQLNLDVGTMIQNGEAVEDLIGKVCFINHVHISEPGLKLIAERELHQKLMKLLTKEDYQGFVSIEMGKRETVTEIEQTLKYVKEIFG